MYKQGYLEIYQDSDGFICIASCPTLEDENYGEIKINKEDLSRLGNAVFQVSEELRGNSEE